MKVKWTAILLLFSAIMSKAESKPVDLTFEQVIQRAGETGPQAGLIQRSYSLAVAERKSALAWSNPALGLVYERVASGGITQRETILQLGKSVSMPWVTLNNHRYWNRKLQAVAKRKEDDLLRILAEKKAGYVRLALWEEKIAMLQELKSSVRRLAETVRSQERVGMLSGQHQHLVALALLSIEELILETQERYRSEQSSWKIEMGIAPEQKTRLITPVVFREINVNQVINSESLIAGNPGLKERRLNVKAAETLIGLEQSRILPEFTLSAGYKNIDTDFKGYVAGISLQLPIVNWNKGPIRKATIISKIEEIELNRFEKQLRQDVKNHILTIEEISEQIQGNSYSRKDFETLITGIENSFLEGWVSALEFLNSIEIVGSGVKSYYATLIKYYESIFELEALTGKQIVNSF